METSEVVRVLDALERAGISILLDGGWGVDALLGEQTRTHTDVDLAIDARDIDAAVSALRALGYEHDRDAEPGLPARYVLVASEERQVDLHRLVLDGDGNGWQPLSETEAWGFYPAEERTTGMVGGRRVACITPSLQLRFHLGWEWDERAVHDMRLLQKRFGIPLPPIGA
jgi:lincosamide nucleotidyltransferase A/C/D/E